MDQKSTLVPVVVAALVGGIAGGAAGRLSAPGPKAATSAAAEPADTAELEVLAPTTESDDRGPKLDCYKAIASVSGVVLVAQDEPVITLHERRPDGSWSRAEHTSGTVTLPASGCSLLLSEVYEDLPE